MTDRLDRRSVLAGGLRAAAAIAGGGAAGALLSGCSHPPGFHSGPAHCCGMGAQEGVHFGGGLVFGTRSEPISLDPTGTRFDPSGVVYARSIYDPLAIPRVDGKIVPYLAKSIVPDAEYTEWTITLRDGVVFHDGTPCDGRALLFCIEQYLASPLVNFAYTDIVKVSPTGDLGVTVSMKTPWVPFDAWLAGYPGGQIAYVFSPMQFNARDRSTGDSLLGRHPIGTGPFMFEEWLGGDHFSARRNPNYWRRDFHGKRLPYLDSITYRPLPSDAERLGELAAGRIDAMHTSDPATILEIRRNGSLTHVEDGATGGGSAVVHDLDVLVLDPRTPPFDELPMRRAAALSFDQQRWIEQGTTGVYLPASGPFPANGAYHAPVGAQRYDPVGARALVDAYTKDHGGNRPRVSLPDSASTDEPAATDFVANGLAAVGFEVTRASVGGGHIPVAPLGYEGSTGVWRITGNVNPDVVPPVSLTSANDGYPTPTEVRFAEAAARAAVDPSDQVLAYERLAAALDAAGEYVWLDDAVWSVAANRGVKNLDGATSPDGVIALPMLSGMIWPTEIWTDSSA